MLREEGPPDISKELAKAKTTTIIEEFDCFTPRRVITIGYSGPNIRKVIREIPRMIQRGLRISGTNVFIDEYYVYAVDPNDIVFHIYYHGRKAFDQRSAMWGWVRIKHGRLFPDGTGSMKIEFYSKLITKWPKKTLIQRIPIYSLLTKIYTYIFYDARRRTLIDRCKFYEEDVIRRVKELLKLVETTPYPKGEA